MFFRNIPIVTRLALAFGLILLFVVGLGLFAWSSMRVLEEKSLAAESAVMPVVEDAHNIGNQVSRNVASLKDYFTSSDMEALSEGLAAFHAAKRTTESLMARVESDPILVPLDVYLTSLNGLYAPYLREVQQALAAHDKFAHARDILYDDISDASEAVQKLLLTHLDGVREEKKVLATTVALTQDMWQLRETLIRARVSNDFGLALMAEKQWEVLLVNVRDIPVQPTHEVCVLLKRELEELTARASQSTGAFIQAWRAETQMLEQLRVTSSIIMSASHRLSMAGVELLGRLANSATEAAVRAMHYTLLLTALAALLGIGLAALLGRDIARPLWRCLRFAQSVASGNLGETLTLPRKDEIGRMATAINTMVSSLRRRIEDQAEMEIAMRQATALSERALSMARAAWWSIRVDRPDQYNASPQMDSLVRVELGGSRPLEEWYLWVAEEDCSAATRLRLALEAVLAGERDIVDITTPLRPPGATEALWVRSLLEAVRDEEGTVLIYMGITQDVTEYMRQQHVLEAATRAQSAFIASMSHEIRTPLNAIIGLGHLLRGTSLTPRQRDYLAKSDSAAQLLVGLINDILDLSKIRAGEMHLEAITFGLHALLRRVMDMAVGLDHAEGLHLELRVGEDVPDLVLGDPLRMQQVLTNLLTNACKFTEQGSVVLDVCMENEKLDTWPAYLGTEVRPRRVRFSLTDTGMGMTPEQAGRLFRPFIQGDATISRRFGGTGLGLAICRNLVELLGGTITVQSQRGQGSCFSFSAVLAQMEHTAGVEYALPCVADHAVVAPSAKPSRILLAEDDEINALIAREILETMGHTVDVAVNGVEAVDMAGVGDYKLVLMDLQMPVMDGISAARALRAMERFRDLPILAMTARTMHGDRARILEAGMDDHIPKPIDPQFLRDTLEKWL